ncbi:MAG: hypothetical protein WKF61_00475 [Luteimonas sp.]
MKKMSLLTGWDDGAAAARRTVHRQVRAWDALPARWRWALVGALILALPATALVMRLDWSRQLTPAELVGLEAWTADTHAPPVAAALERVKRDRKVTVDEAHGVIEVAKAASSPPGLMEPVGWTR